MCNARQIFGHLALGPVYDVAGPGRVWDLDDATGPAQGADTGYF